MEKKHKSYTMGTKRQRKASLRAAASVPNSLIMDIADVPPIELNPPSAGSNKAISIAKSIPKYTEPELEASPSKKKKKKASGSIEKNNFASQEAKKPKKRKHHSEIQDKDNGNAMQIKKKKEKVLMADVHNLKVELGIPSILDQDKEALISADNQQKTPVAKLVKSNGNIEEDTQEKYPILKDKELIDRFLKVPLTNNQKGRIRQAIKLTLQGTTTQLFPDVINAKIQAILRSSTDLTDSDLRRVRILYNMLKTALDAPEQLAETTPKKKKDKKKKKEGGDKKKKEDGDKKEKEDGENKKEAKKVKGPKRYVVFLGNLPLSVNKDKIMDHFSELNEHIVDIRLPKRPEGHKSSIAYVELGNEASYELALSKHHSMMDTKRIKVLYTTQKNSKISRAQASSKSAKLIALQKAGKLIGSIPKTKKRSHRRAIMKKAKANESATPE